MNKIPNLTIKSVLQIYTFLLTILLIILLIMLNNKGKFLLSFFLGVCSGYFSIVIHFSKINYLVKKASQNYYRPSFLWIFANCLVWMTALIISYFFQGATGVMVAAGTLFLLKPSYYLIMLSFKGGE